MVRLSNSTGATQRLLKGKRYMPVIALVLLLVWFAVLPVAAQSEVSFAAQVDKSTLSADEYLTLELILTGPFRNADKPDFPQMEDFYVLSSGQSSQFSLLNNQMSSRIVYSYRLQPVRNGTLTIPSISVTVGDETYSTEPLAVEVTAGSAPAPQPVQPPAADELTEDAPDELAGQNFYVQAEVDNTTPYVSQQIIYTFRLYQRINFSRQPSLDWPEFTGFLAYDLTPNKQYYQTVGSEQYLVTDVRRMLFPTSSGSVTLDPTLLSIPGDIFNQGFLLQTNPVTIDVHPLPEGAPVGFNGAVGQFDIEAWVEPEVSKVNEPVSLFVRMKGTGSINSLPDPTADVLQDLAGWRAYDPQITTQTEQVSEVLQGEKVIERLMLPSNSGLLKVPAFSLTYFDPDTVTYRQVETVPLEVKIAEGDAEAPGVVIIGDGKQDIEVLGADIRHIKPAPPALAVTQPSLVQQPLYWAGWVIPMCTVAGVYLWYRHRRNLERDSVYSRQQRALNSARRRLRELRNPVSEDAVYAGVAQVLAQYVSDKLGVSPAGLTREGMRKSLAPRISSEDFELLLACLDWADSGRFAPAAEGRQAHDLVAQSLDLIKNIEKVLE